MKNSELLVNCYKNGEFLRSWRVKQELTTVGSSRHAAIQFPDLEGFHFLIEKNDGWLVSNLSQSSFCDDNLDYIAIKDTATLNLKGYKFEFQVFEKRKLETLEKFEKTGGQFFQNYLVFLDEQFVESEQIAAGKKFQFKGQEFGPYNESELPKWHDLGQGYKVFYRPGYHQSHSAATLPSSDNLQLFGGSAIGAIVVILLSMWITPHQAESEIIAEILQPKPFEKHKILKKKPVEVPPVAKISVPKASGAASANKGGAQTTNKNTKSRLNQLIGKVAKTVSNTGFKIRNKGGKTADSKIAGGTSMGSSIEKGGNLSDFDSNFNGVGTKGRAGGQGSKSFGRVGSRGVQNVGVGILDEETEIVGGLDRDVIARYIKSQLGQILYCYERQLSANPDLYGKIQVKFEIQGNGSVQQQRIKETTLRNRNVEDCILTKVAKWNFPKPEGGTRVVVTYPFLFKSTN